MDLEFAEDHEQTSRTIMRVHGVLTELYALLGDYSPMWFTQRENERAERALHELNQLVSLYPNQSAERNALIEIGEVTRIIPHDLPPPRT
jgi:outer membrane protein assembly factor BamD (BamD/ComL family)